MNPTVERSDDVHLGSASGPMKLLTLIGALVCLAGASALVVVTALGGAALPALTPKATRLTTHLTALIESEGIAAAARDYRALRAQGFPGWSEREFETNALGYALLGQGRTAEATTVLELNAETHPTSANTYDSLGELYASSGQGARALESYRRALALNPQLKSARTALRRLSGEERGPLPPLLLLHIVSGALMLLAGAGAMVTTKGSRWHARAGTGFFFAMLAMAVSAGVLAATARPLGFNNLCVAAFTVYLITTGRRAARERLTRPGALDWACALAAVAIGAAFARYGLERDFPTEATAEHRAALTFGALAFLGAALDLRMIRQGGVRGAARISRHIWRMGLPLFIGATSLFLGQEQVFPDALRDSGALLIPGLLVALTTVAYLLRARFASGFRREWSGPGRLPRRS